MPRLHAAAESAIFGAMQNHHYETDQAPLLFIADLHLDPGRPSALVAFLDFLTGPAREASALFILGDLFEAWIGDDARPPDDPVAPALRSLSDDGTQVFLMHGNRDFLLGEAFARDAGARLLAEPTRITIDGTPTLLEHGDALCTDDHSYQAFRRQVRDPAWQAQFLALPVEERLAQAQAARSRSSDDIAEKTESIMDVNQQAVADRFRAFDARRLIHGHTHRPAFHDHEVDQKNRQRIVLGDWFTQGSVLKADDGHYELTTLPIESASGP